MDWLGGVVAMVAIFGWVFLIARRGHFEAIKKKPWLLVLLLALTPLTSLLISIRLPASTLSPIPNLPVEILQPVVVVFFALPLVFAAGLLGPIASTLVGLASGIWLGLYGTHSLFTPVEVAGIGLFYGIAVSQAYRTGFFRLLRHPVGAAFVIGLGFVPVFLLSSFLTTPGEIAERIDFAITQNWLRIGARVIELVVAGGLAEIFFLSSAKGWRRPKELTPSPAEASLQTRFLSLTLPVAVVLLVALVIGDWLVAGQAARRMVEVRLSGTAKIAADSLPYFLEAGQSLLIDMAQPDLIELAPVTLSTQLAERIRAIPYFRQLTVFDLNEQIRGGYPQMEESQLRLTPEEKTAITLALQGVLIQVYTVPPFPGERSAQVSFVASIADESGEVTGVLLGRTDLESNPFTRPALNALEGIALEQGEGFILDENLRVLYYTKETSALTAADTYVGRMPEAGALTEDVSSTGSKQLVFAQPVVGRPWTVMAIIPARNAQQIALEIALPMLVVLILLFSLAFILLRLSLSAVTRNLSRLSDQAGMIAQGQLSQPLEFKGVDEVGRLGQSFEKMRVSLKRRLDELNKLLKVSQGVAANLEVVEAIRPILNAALSGEAVSARAVLIQEVRMDLDGDQLVRIGAGTATNIYEHLDSQIFDLMRTQEVLTIPNTTRVRRIVPATNMSHPMAIIAFALYFENTYFGTFWIGYDRPKSFTEDEVRFFSTLASEASLAAANSRLYAAAEVGRRRLEAVLSSTPEPVLVFDEKDRLLLLNPAAMHVPGLVQSAMPSRHVKDVLSAEPLVKLITAPLDERIVSREINLANGKIYHASVAPVTGDEMQLGKVCVLRDITHYKELDSIKSDFVATVSHDLRTPLTLMRGYTSMLSMVGELNEQQKNYVNKMVNGVEAMSHLVSNLLDLGRIDAGISLHLEEISPETVIEKIIKQHQPQAAQKSISLKSEGLPDGKRVTMVADLALLQQALINLVDNAIKYSRSKGQVLIKLKLSGEHVLFEVHDTGIGIAPLDLPRLFEKFYRSGRREAYEQRGTGLGLAIVKSICERHHGRVWVDSQLGKGSVFTMEFPLRQEAQAVNRQP